ncbi:ABATE domain-containing protein [Amycolatopsis sp. PS_44_ISF1]|uniref:CGNR zinc finger domain-containing protein n=1 Tax=Amycolatopsis sp. PS_44_ISF1 TaxID=2974917 RepID=UPI0028DE0719|nr:ABATE domain-containing protein [Amycolatopsis sp. PS_44_ISF1]MDT8909974.1 ABATE domain-containing protein [Amycolatopsis sp. PS_44_ISF1]
MDWTFDGGRRCLDLVNTLRSRHLAEGVELLTSPEALAEWLRLAGFAVDVVTSEDLATAIRLREAVDRLLTQPPDEADAAIVNQLAASPPPARLVVDGGVLLREVSVPPDGVASALGAIAADAVDLAPSEAPVRICSAEDCGLRFCDTSPRRTRQWCSMARCGNRAKARAHYARVQVRNR